MQRLGIISNPRSRGHLDGVAGLDGADAGLPHALPPDRAALRATLADFAAQGVTLLVVNGGDGTLREVLGALPEAWPGPPPALAPLAAGRTNLLARTLGQRGKGPAALQALRDAAAAGRLRRELRPVLEVHRAGLGEAPLRGLLFGAAGFVHATRMANGAPRQRGLKDNAAVGATALLTAVQTLSGRGPQARALRQGTPMRVAVDGAAGVEAPRFILLATTLDRLMFGLWPFWGDGAGALRWLDVAAPPPRLLGGLWSLLRRRPPGLPGWHSGRADALDLSLDEPFVLDGELFDPGPAGVRLRPSTPLVFVSA
ncbi:diacylglycerol kinase family protein [Roseomonas haemaphysalidis]|uniref:Diacylglycerol kinase n=1 Tax=Roseomonas haemaphysalidis TaxID=2768162 RepID=A0ABS3KLZ4_9PROT|nr:diacylglycerol kinase family protein [Roseomonas haemaphysalidis]MBO1078047.1 diacylglycerol kinase [Roseomonas haemaphysalidis]